jgi:hypothetical protein
LSFHEQGGQFERLKENGFNESCALRS